MAVMSEPRLRAVNLKTEPVSNSKISPVQYTYNLYPSRFAPAFYRTFPQLSLLEFSETEGLKDAHGSRS